MKHLFSSGVVLVFNLLLILPVAAQDGDDYLSNQTTFDGTVIHLKNSGKIFVLEEVVVIHPMDQQGIVYVAPNGEVSVSGAETTTEGGVTRVTFPDGTEVRVYNNWYIEVSYPDGTRVDHQPGGRLEVFYTDGSSVILTRGSTQITAVNPGDADIPFVRATRDLVTRHGPGVNWYEYGTLENGQLRRVIGQSIGPDGALWYRLADDAWVRSDEVTPTHGRFDNLPWVSSDDSTTIVPPPTSQTIPSGGGTRVYGEMVILPNGSHIRPAFPVLIRSMDGQSIVVVQADGTFNVRLGENAGAPEITQEHYAPSTVTTSDGTKVSIYDGGHIETEYPDGTKAVRQPDQSVSVFNPDGSQSVVAADGVNVTHTQPGDNNPIPYVRATSDLTTRHGPGLNWYEYGTLGNGQVRQVIGQATDPYESVWYKLADGSWVRQVDVIRSRSGDFMHIPWFDAEGRVLAEFVPSPGSDDIIRSFTMPNNSAISLGNPMLITESDSHTWVFIHPDDTIHIEQGPVGVWIRPEGQVKVEGQGTRPEVIEQDDGPTIIRFPGGTRVEVFANGYRRLVFPNGIKIVCDTNNHFDVFYPDGTSATISPDGTNVMILSPVYGGPYVRADRDLTTRRGPGINWYEHGSLTAGQVIRVTGRALGPARAVWYRLADGSWIRSDDVTQAAGSFDQIQWYDSDDAQTPISPPTKYQTPPDAAPGKPVHVLPDSDRRIEIPGQSVRMANGSHIWIGMAVMISSTTREDHLFIDREGNLTLDHFGPGNEPPATQIAGGTQVVFTDGTTIVIHVDEGTTIDYIDGSKAVLGADGVSITTTGPGGVGDGREGTMWPPPTGSTLDGNLFVEPVNVQNAAEVGAVGIWFTTDKAFSAEPLGPLLKITGADGVYLYELDPGDPDLVNRIPAQGIGQARLSPDGTQLAAGSFVDGSLSLWDVPTGHPTSTWLAHGHTIWDIEFSPDGTTLFTTGNDDSFYPLPAGVKDEIRVWDAATGENLFTWEDQAMVLDIDVSPDGQWLASGGGFSDVLIWNVTTQTVVKRINHNPAVTNDHVQSVDFSADGVWLTAAGIDDVGVYRTDTWQRTATVGGPSLSGHVVAFSPVSDGVLFVGSDDLKMYDPTTGEDLGTLQRFDEHQQLFDMKVNPEGTALVTTLVTLDDTYNIVDSEITFWGVIGPDTPSAEVKKVQLGAE